MNILSDNWCCMNCAHCGECKDNDNFDIFGYCFEYLSECPPTFDEILEENKDILQRLKND